ncbi:MAG: TIGR02281 family clan AA aspartic protease [Alphaproteobacteria bacterium]
MVNRRTSWPGGGRPRVFWFILIAVIALVGLLVWRFPYAVSDSRDWMNLIYLLAILILVSGGVFHHGFRARRSIRHAAIWIGLACAIGLAYSNRFEFAALGNRFLGELVPGLGVEGDSGEILFRAGAGGHYQVEGRVNGVPVRFLVDTGASDVVLSPRDAARIGFDPAALDFSRTYRTANGAVQAAPVTLDAIEIGPIAIRNVSAAVNGAALDNSLLGMSFLNRLTGYRVENGTLTLQYRPRR